MRAIPCTLIAAAIVAGCASPPPPSADAGQAQLMFVHSADDLKVEPATQTLRLVKVNPQTVYFSDRPQRVAGNLELPEYLKTWNDGRDSFNADPQNATLFIDWHGVGGGPGFHGVGVGRRGVGWR